ncbi:MAG: hypothetical protein D6730_25205 [Bacteroidetes bacterium]|nr:MAG: hypothetical protein D6730_25205 [Bacteroidota bacterium]
MEDILKKVLYTGVGLVSLTAEKLQQAVDELVEKEKMTEEEGKKVVEEFQQESQSRKQELEERLKSFIKNLSDNLSFTSKKDWEELVKRVEALEAQVNAHHEVKEVVKKHTPKTNGTKKS